MEIRFSPSKTEVQTIIERNKGTLANSVIYYMDDEQITVRTSSKYEAVKFDEVIPDDKRDINQIGTGPEIDFIGHLNGWMDRELNW